jgi:uncharacterized Zn-binding protein involved in type VI secretion
MLPVARAGDTAICPADVHLVPPVIGVPTPFPVTGPIVQGSTKAFALGLPVARNNDQGVHAVCIGTNTFNVSSASTKTFEGQGLARLTDTTRHCGEISGTGTIIMGAPIVFTD